MGKQNHYVSRRTPEKLWFGLTSKFVDRVGLRVGNLTVKAYAGTSNYHRIWVCTCDCGNERTVSWRDLSRHHTTSCGCRAHSGLVAGGSNKKDWGEARFNDLFKIYQRSAASRKLEFTIDKVDFRRITRLPCRYCGRLPSQVIKAGHECRGSYVYNGIDRIDNSAGYISGNVCPCCKFCNIAKGTLSEADFFKNVLRTARHITKIQRRREAAPHQSFLFPEPEKEPFNADPEDILRAWGLL